MEQGEELVAKLQAEAATARRLQRVLLAVTAVACTGCTLLAMRQPSFAAQQAMPMLAQEWHQYNTQWEACAKDPSCDAWDNSQAKTLIARTRAAFQEPDRINGVVPPGKAAMSMGSPGAPFSNKPTHTMLEYVNRQPLENGTSTLYAVWYNSRRVMERTPIHVHPETQFTCVLNGTLMFIAEGMPIRNYSNGECYVMPGMTKMVSVNVGDSAYVDLDIFRVSAGSVPWIVIEPDYYWLQTTQFDQKDQHNAPGQRAVLLP
jgi:hypothetical protein